MLPRYGFISNGGKFSFLIVPRVGSEQYLAGNIDGGQKITEV